MFLYVLDRVQELFKFFHEIEFLDKLHDLIIFLLEHGKTIAQLLHLRL